MPRKQGFLAWLICFGIIAFLVWAAADAGFLTYAYYADASYLVLVIGGLFALATFRCGLTAFAVANEADAVDGMLLGNGDLPNGSHIGTVIKDKKSLRQYLGELGDRCDTGWFLADVMLKLGLAGTVVGFVIMLSSVADIQGSDINTVQDVLINMSSGMGTALFTTLSGLVANGLTTIQYYILEQHFNTLEKQAARIR